MWIFLAPLIGFIDYSYLYRNMSSLDTVIQIEGLYENYAMMRGMSDIALGILPRSYEILNIDFYDNNLFN